MKKAKKTKSPQLAASVDQDIVGLITTLVQKLVSLETKIDTVLSRLPQRPVEPSRQQPVVSPSVERPRDPRPMFQAVCADCGRQCEVPFRPSSGRSVYCKECFARRKASGAFPPRTETAPVKTPPAPQVSPAPVVKKKPAVKKTKKK